MTARKYAQEKTEKIKLLHGLAVTLVKDHLRGWTVNTCDNEDNDIWIFLDGPEERRARIELIDWHTGKPRFAFTGCYPRDKGNNFMVYDEDDPPKITVSANRSVTDIATDLSRRFWPHYEALYRQVIKRIALANSRMASINDQANELAAVLESKVYRFGDNSNNNPRITAPNDTYGHFEVLSPDSIAVDLHNLTLEQALRIAYILVDNSDDSPPSPKPAPNKPTLPEPRYSIDDYLSTPKLATGQLSLF